MTLYRQYNTLLAMPGGSAFDGISGPPEWTTQAVCASVDPAIFFPDRGEASTAAKRVCRTCPVTVQCLAYALEHEDTFDIFGVWGGLSAPERNQLRRDRAVAEGRPLKVCALPECDEPAMGSPSAKYCSRAHASVMSHRRAHARRRAS